MAATLALGVALSLGLRAQTLPGLGGKGAGPRQPPISRIEVTLPSSASVDQLLRAGYDVDGVRGNVATVWVEDDELTNLRVAGWETKVLPVPSAKALGEYNNSTNVAIMLDGYATNYPSLCRKVSLGKSVQGRDIWALKITTNPDAAQDKPKVRYLSTMHGNEQLGTELCLYLIDLLIKGYGSNNTRCVNLVSNVETWIVPLLNPDGRDRSTPERYNANTKDLNRCFQ